MLQKDKGKTIIAVIGYGSQGKAIALNLRDSGYDVRVGLRLRSRTRKLLRADRFKSDFTIETAVTGADIVCFAFPDHLHGDVLRKNIAPSLGDGAGLLFLHALSVHFKLVKLPDACDVMLIAPHAPGPAVREKFQSDRSVSAFLAIAQDYSGKARTIAIRLATGIGIKRSRLVDTTFRDEAIGDIFGEQAVLCGGLAALVKTGFEVLIEKGHDPDHAYLEVAYQLELIATLIKRHGIEGMFERISVAARFGSAETGPKLINAAVKRRMEQVYARVSSGKFVEMLRRLDSDQIKNLKSTLKQLSHPSLEKAARKFAD